jgi:tripartite-type tricarboxylate transporter receptor subunit TctC
MIRNSFSICFLLAVAAGFSAPAHSQAWPARTVRIVAPFAPGGTADTLGRIVAAQLTQSLGQTFVVDNRPGAGGLLGSDSVAKAAPDGYTFVVSGVASHVIAPVLAAKPPFNPETDFTHVALLGGPPVVFGVHPSLPVQNLKAFVAFVKARPGEVIYGSPGVGTQGHLTAELFKQQTGIDIVHVPYRGASNAVVDIVAGHIHGISTTLTTASAQIKAGRVRALAISSAARLPAYRDVPTFADFGYRGMVATVWFSLSGPAGVQKEIVDRLNAEVRKALHAPEVRERLQRDGIMPNQLTARQFSDYLTAEIRRWTPVIRKSGATAN